MLTRRSRHQLHFFLTKHKHLPPLHQFQPEFLSLFKSDRETFHSIRHKLLDFQGQLSSALFSSIVSVYHSTKM
ncbi:hypothetical protein BDQ12DRAFT_687018 [Crucibulum laeve]|uniref:Uncharacterized protein n=1 Tax=Crucibulum laeve TaxID=68775 RepID=A0A5C3LUG6_9AGAR|nr:hypothetical protein BDQ12DRAFT_687018 [Crucibulum laeve]